MSEFTRKLPSFRDDKVLFENNDYAIRVGVIKDDSMDVYVVVNKATGAVEFAHEVYSLAKEWVEYFQEKNNPTSKEKMVAAEPAISRRAN